MLCVTRIRIALFGLAMAAPAVVLAGPPDFAHPKKKTQKPHLCARCAAAQQQAANAGYVAPPPMVTANGECTTCQPGQPMIMNGAPVVMNGAPVVMNGAPVVMNGAPGFAVVGEPTPIGVVQASYQPSAAQASTVPGRAVVGPATQFGPSAMPTGSPNLVGSSQVHHRPNVVGHLLGFRRFQTFHEAKFEKEKASHAAIPYGSYDKPVTELPASVVFGR
jgi:hypothetical protein